MKVQVGGGFVAVAPAVTADGEALRRRATLRPRTRALVVLHEGEDVNGRLVQAVSRLRSEPVIARAESGEALPDPATFRLAVLVGSASFADALASGQLASEVEWIRQADAAGTAVFGIGHGARALAYAFGGTIDAAPEPHRGWTLVETTVPHRIAAGPWLAWQHDVITLPDGAEVLAGNRAAGVRIGPRRRRVRSRGDGECGPAVGARSGIGIGIGCVAVNRRAQAGRRRRRGSEPSPHRGVRRGGLTSSSRGGRAVLGGLPPDTLSRSCTPTLPG